MNLRLFAIAILISALPSFGSADAAITLNRGDFIAAEKVSREGETILSLRLSKSGKAKLKKLNEHFVGKEVHTELGGVSSNLKLRDQIKGDSLEMGPYSQEDAQKIIAEVNSKK